MPNKIYIIVGVIVVFMAGYFWGGESRYEDLAQALAASQKDFGDTAQALATSDAKLQELQLKLETIQKAEDEKTAKSKKQSLKKKAAQEEGAENGARPGLADFDNFESCIYRADTSLVDIDFIMKCNAGNEVAMKKCLMTDDHAANGLTYLSHATACWKKTHP